jgi:glutathione S-transferase
MLRLTHREPLTVNMCRQYYEAEDAPLAKAFKVSIEQRPRIAAYLASERCQPWDKDSMM